MQIGMIGLGRMGANMSRRLALGNISVVGFDASDAARTAMSELSAVATVRAAFGGQAIKPVEPDPSGSGVTGSCRLS